MLRMLLNQQRCFMNLLGIKQNEEFSLEHLIDDPEFVSAAVGLISESTEVLNEVNVATRPWKQGKSLDEVRKALVEEAIDVLFYFLEIANILGLTEEEIASQYGRKLIINMSRISEKLHSEPLRLALEAILSTAVVKEEIYRTGSTREILDGCSNLREVCELPIL